MIILHHYEPGNGFFQQALLMLMATILSLSSLSWEPIRAILNYRACLVFSCLLEQFLVLTLA